MPKTLDYNSKQKAQHKVVLFLYTLKKFPQYYLHINNKEVPLPSFKI